MIPRAHITHWRQHAPWIQDVQVEQDLIISRAVVELFRHPDVSCSLAFRGGTALHKLHLEPARYSEDIDLVQVHQEPIGATIDAIREVLRPWLGESVNWEQKHARFILRYQVGSEPRSAPPIRLKVEINTRGHFTVNGLQAQEFAVESPWFEGRAEVTTYALEELLGTKLRALYQRNKGRDLFDLYYALEQVDPSVPEVVEICRKYLQRGENTVSRAEFERNLEEKRSDAGFRTDVKPLVASRIDWDFETALENVMTEYVPEFPGKGWEGRSS